MYNYLLIDQNSLFSVQLFTNTHIMSGVKFLQCHFLGKNINKNFNEPLIIPKDLKIF